MHFSRETLQKFFGFLALFLAHDFLNCHPMLEVGRFLNMQQCDSATRRLGPAASEMQRDLHLLAVVNDDEEDPLIH